MTTQVSLFSGDSGEAVEDLAEAAEVIPFSFSITSYGADYPVDGLIKRLQAGDIIVPIFGAKAEPEPNVVAFQREYVWSKLQADRFVESLLLGLPVPGIFLVKEQDGRFLVLDGHQRLRTLQRFFEGIWRGKEFRLEYVQQRFAGLGYKDLDPEDRRRFDDSIIHATVVRQDEPSEDQSSIYLVFERLNSGGTILQPQEIRLALYHGELAELLAELNEHPSWRELYGKRSPRQKDIELIVRFFALYFFSGSYRRPMKGFLNRYMATNRHLTNQSGTQLQSLFTATSDAILRGIGESAFKPKKTINAAVVDSVMVGVATRLGRDPRAVEVGELRAAYDQLMANEVYSAAVSKATADEESVAARIRLAIEALT